MKRITRRALLAGGVVGAGAAALEWLSLSGRLDHRRPPVASAEERWRASVAALDPTRAAIVHVAHSTHLVSVGGAKMLTDPWFHDPAFGALSHETAPAVLPSEIGVLDAILISHDHADHADLRAIDRMDKRAAVLVATAELASKVRSLGFSDVAVLAPWEEREVGGAIVAAVPGLHDVYEIGFVVRGNGQSVYFAGDSRLHPDLPAIAERFAPDASILPVDGTRIGGGALHVMTPEDAVFAARVLGSRLVVPSHADAVFSDALVEHVLASMVPRAKEAFATLVGQRLAGVRCAVPAPGEIVTL